MVLDHQPAVTDVDYITLLVVTAGEEIPEDGCQAGVVNVFMDRDNQGNNGPYGVH